jgi:hypothetical protein
MKIQSKQCYFSTACMAVLLALMHVSSAQGVAAQDTPIADSKIAALQTEFAQFAQLSPATSSSSKRRACKNMVRSGAALIKASPTAPNRFRVLAIMLQSQKRLLLMDDAERNRAKLFEICTQLAQAPDAYAEVRLDADLLLSDKELTLKEADLATRTMALEALVERYRDTPGEAKSLMMAALIAPKLEAFEFEQTIFKTMGERFADDPALMEFRLKRVGVGRIDVLFTGTFARADGVSLRFPADQLGQTCLMVFWSQQTPDLEEYLKQIDEQANLHSGLLKIFSFNLDELPDAGEEMLRGLELEWTAMRLPGGKNSQTFRTYGQTGSAALLVNAYGHTIITSELAKYGHGQTAKVGFVIPDKVIAHERFLAQLQSLFIGDFLVMNTDVDNKADRALDPVPQETLDAIQACFVAAPMRYRLTSEQALANYTKAEQFCRDAIAKHAKAGDLWRVRNHRMIALLGMWNLATEPKYLEAAAEEARTALNAAFPKSAAVVPQFCLAKAALRGGERDAKAVLANLIEATGQADAPALAYAAASILALDACDKELHAYYREKLLETHANHPQLWPVVVFLRDRYHTYALLKANDARFERQQARGYLINHGGAVTRNPLPAIELKTLDGGTLDLPQDNEGKLTLLMFIEPPADLEAEIPFEMLGKPAEGKQGEVQGTLQFATGIAGRHIYNEVNVVLAFVSEDVERIKALAEKNAWTCQIAMVPGGLKNPMVRQLGILSADRVANVFLIRRDGTVAWQTSGLKFKAAFSHGYSVFLGMTIQIEWCEIARATEALEQGDFKQAVHLFAGPFPKKKDERYGWTAPRFHARAIANMALQNWEAALVDIDTAIAAHEEEYNHLKRHPCDSMVTMYAIKADILEKLGKPAEAKAAKEYSDTPTQSYGTSRYDLFHRKLNELELSQPQGK